jgi:hypothetical protein
MNYVLYKTIYTKDFTTTQMCFYEINVPSEIDQKAYKSKSPMHHKLDEKNITTVL